MLVSIDTNKPIRAIPHRREFDGWMRKLLASPDGAVKLAAIEDELERRIDSDEIHTSSWMPGNDWSGTVFDPIYQDACGHNVEVSGLFFGLLVWKAFMDHPDHWAFGRYEVNNIPIRGLTYFRVR